MPLAQTAWDIIAAQPRQTDYVFGRARRGFSSVKVLLDEHMHADLPWVTHDLRRSARSLLSRGRVPSDVAELMLGHLLPGMRRRYDRHQFHHEKAAGFVFASARSRRGAIPALTMARWRYRPSSPDWIRRSLRESAFREHIVRAYRGDTKPLREYLVSDDRITPEHREQLADLIYWRIQKKQRGKRGKAPTFNPDREGERLIVHYVRKLKRQKYGNRRLPRGGLRKLLDEVIEQLGSHGFFDDYQGTMSKERILADLKRGKRSPKL